MHYQHQVTPEGVGPAGEMVTAAKPSAAEFFETKAAGMDPGFAKSGLGALEKSSGFLTGLAKLYKQIRLVKQD